MKIELSPGEILEVGFSGSDGIITVEMGKYPSALLHEVPTDAVPFIRGSSDLPDSSGRTGVIYEETFPADSGQVLPCLSPNHHVLVLCADGRKQWKAVANLLPSDVLPTTEHSST